MSFFDNNKHVGLALIIVGLLSIIISIAGIASAFLDDNDWLPATVGGVGTLLFGLLLVYFGLTVRNSSNDKVMNLSGLVMVIGIGSIITGIFGAAAGALGDETVWDAIASAIVAIVIGLILIWVSTKISGANKNAISSIIWVLLVVAMVIMVIVSLFDIVTAALDTQWADLLMGVCWFIIYAYGLFSSVSPEVKKSMGI